MKKYTVCDKCRKHFRIEDIIIGNHGRLCKDCYPIVKEAHSMIFYKLSEINKRKELINIDF